MKKLEIDLNKLFVLKKLLIYVTYIFTGELILGFTGRTFEIFGVAIRHILYVAEFILLYTYVVTYMIANKISILKKGKQKNLWRNIKLLDFFVFLYAMSTIVSFVVIPKLTGGSVYLAKCEILDALAMLLLFFGMRLLIEWNQIDIERYKKVLYWIILFYAIMHIIFFLGQKENGDFVQEIFINAKNFLGENSTFPPVILGHGGYPRIMFSTSVYLIIGIYLVLYRIKEIRIPDYFIYGIFIIAILTTMTKSIWFGIAVGMGVFWLLFLSVQLKKKNQKNLIQSIFFVVGTIGLIILVNATLFEGLVGIRMGNAFATSSNEDLISDAPISGTSVQPSESNEEIALEIENNSEKKILDATDQNGAIISNNIKIEQTKRLIDKWKERPIFGFGYGSYIEGYTRSDEAIFSYEMQLPALLMKTGLIGVVLLIAVFFVAMLTLYKRCRQEKKYGRFFSWLFLVISYVLTLQTNPLFLSFTGFSIFLFILLLSSEPRSNSQKTSEVDLPKEAL